MVEDVTGLLVAKSSVRIGFQKTKRDVLRSASERRPVKTGWSLRNLVTEDGCSLNFV